MSKFHPQQLLEPAKALSIARYRPLRPSKGSFGRLGDPSFNHSSPLLNSTGPSNTDMALGPTQATGTPIVTHDPNVTADSPIPEPGQRVLDTPNKHRVSDLVDVNEFKNLPVEKVHRSSVIELKFRSALTMLDFATRFAARHALPPTGLNRKHQRNDCGPSRSK
ncbi:hypothetical protein CROQUDRAFT_107646 [Cronartium quercuum f. sp. fusiforme G11]|uniref:Uncharacterized protein n=1 Tax=Cronartium quercuum f. sp. fusiforme G11 TaxID=708437 RepID=A0A9P6TBI3_9BASI|nr:hypothetical protein CROQUDRAFT_107646 [Cronartium quercuum f. sp. fusiforme G11]